MKIRLPIIIGLAVLILGSLAFGLMKAWPEDIQKVIFENGFLTVHAKEISLKSLINEISKKSNIQISIDPGIEDKTITVDFENQPIEQGLKTILQTAGISDKAVVYKKTTEEGRPDQWVIERVYLPEKGASQINQPTPFIIANIKKITSEQGFIAPIWSSTNPDQIFFSTYGFGGIYMISLSDEKIISLTEDEASGFQFIQTRDGRYIVYRTRIDSGSIIRSVDIQSRQIKNISAVSRDISLPQEIAPGIIAYKAEGQTQLKRIPSNEISFSEQPFAYQQNDNIFVEIGKNIFQVTKGDGKYYLPKVSPDRKKVVYEELATGIYISNIDGTDTIHIGRGNNPNWSPDSKYIVYDLSQDDGHNIVASELNIADISRASKFPLTNSPNLIESKPSFSSDGNKIAFDANGAIYTADLLNIKY